MTYLLDRMLDALMLPSLMVTVACVAVAGVGYALVIRGALEGEVDGMTDREGEGMGITRELRDVADRIDERFSRELTAKQDEVGE